MIRFFRRLILVTLLAAGTALSLSADVMRWAFEGSDVAPDPAVTWGRLDNGLRYAIRRNSLPAGHVSFRLGVQVGFAHELSFEHGFAHFVEHMAFNGTKHFPAETLAAALEKRGVELGPELSAFTFLTHTLYCLDAPSNTPADLACMFTVLRDFADGLEFNAKQVKRERGVIASELRDRQSPAQRVDLARRRFLYPLGPLGNSVAGDVDAATPAGLRRFYDRWYRPERMILVVVGDADPAALEALVHQYFDSLRARSAVPPEFDPGFVANPAVGTTSVYHDPKINGLTVEVNSVLPRTEPDNQAARRRWVARNLLLYLLNVRLHNLVRENPGRLLDCDARSTFGNPFSLETTVSFTAPSAEWKFGITTLEQELRRSFEYGFTSDEVAVARAASLAGAEQRLKASATDHSPALAVEILQQALWGFVTTSPADDLDRIRAWLPEIGAREMNQAWRSLWEQGRARIFAHGYFPLVNAERLLDTAFAASLRQPIAAPTKKATPPFGYTDFGPPGVIRRREDLPELGILLVEFANGVRVNLKRTSFEAATVHLAARLGHGRWSEPPGKPGLGFLAGGTLLSGALGRHPAEELQRLLAASEVSLNFGCEEDCFSFSGQAASRSLERLLQLLAAYLTDPAWNPEATALATTQLTSYLHDLNFTPEGVVNRFGLATLAGGDPRYASPTVEEVRARTTAELKAWIDPVLHSGPLEVGLVGDFDPEETIALLSRTLGALPPRSPDSRGFPPVRFSKQPAVHRLDYFGEANRAGIEIAWPLWHCNDVKVSRQTEVLCAVLGDRVRQKVREDLGATYSPLVTFWKSDVSEPDGYLFAYITVKPDQAASLTKLLLDLADRLSRRGATPQEFSLAREPILDRTVTDQNENDYWVRNIISSVQGKPEVRQWPQTRLPDLRAMTVDDVNLLARAVLPASHAIVFSALPGKNGRP